MKKRYRIKYKEEFKAIELNFGKRPHSWNNIGQMDWMFGLDVTKEYQRGIFYVSESRNPSAKKSTKSMWRIESKQAVEYYPEEEVIENFKQY